MARSRGWYLLIAVAALTALAATTSARSPDARALVAVNVTASCAGSGVTFTVDPWVARVARGDSLIWNSTGADSVDITPMRGNWPFRGNPSRGRGRAPARAGAVAPNAPPGQRSAYQITLWCGDRTVIIDPEVEVGDDL